MAKGGAGRRYALLDGQGDGLGRTLAAELNRQGYPVSHQTVNEVLQSLGYSLQVNRKTREGAGHPDRNAQFEHIARRAKPFQRRGQPVISVDIKKKEFAGDLKNDWSYTIASADSDQINKQLRRLRSKLKK